MRMITYCIHCKKELVENKEGSDVWLEDLNGNPQCLDELSGEYFPHDPTMNDKIYLLNTKK